ncbi:MAG: T9SS type A sorting domain-containing protein [Bacteroidetes bacterium]|nr:MAG: T9SS type A sorting domain-containing protein [Bacteroidota bacterium]
MRSLILAGFIGLFQFSAHGQFACGDFKNVASPAGVPNLNYSALSDTFDIHHTHLDLDLYAIPVNDFKAIASLDVERLMNSSSFRFQLDGFSVDSATVNGQSVSVVPAGTSPFVQLTSLPTSWSVGTHANVVIYYSGAAPADPTGWGGWHQTSPYFFNLGVGFGVNPHSYGRSLFPAFDNFVEHSTYSFNILTKSPRKAYANGVRTSMVINGDSIHQSWDCTDPMSAYLASVAVSNYAELEGTLNKVGGSTVPSLILARPADTANAKSSFGHLQGILTSFENWYGPYVWDKVGYALTATGAMEHVTSIHLPVGLADGTYNREDIIAHELAHHWWGNLLTCATAEDMWINEGLAEFSSHLYEEDVYSRERYIRTVRGNQLYVLNYARKDDGGYFALNGIDHSTTYGTHVYQKGAWIGHNLRGYLGDSIFSAAVTSVLSNYAHTNVTTAQFQNYMSAASGVSLADFFNDWITTPGHVAISIDSIESTASGNNWDVRIDLSQNRKARNTYLSSAPMVLNLYGPNGEKHRATIMVEQAHESHLLVGLNFNPVYATINEGEDYLAGTTYNRVKGIGFGIFNLDNAKARLTVNTATDSHYVYVAHHWAGPEQRSSIANVSSNRFWTIRGMWGSDFDAGLRLFYDGRIANGGMDDDLVSVTEDSLVLLYRFDASEEWTLYPHFTKNTMGSASDQFGQINLTKILPGDYVLANASADIGLKESGMGIPPLRVYPNPNHGTLKIELLAEASGSTPLQIVDVSGKSVFETDWQLVPGMNEKVLELNIPSGSYIVKTKTGEQKILFTR